MAEEKDLQSNFEGVSDFLSGLQRQAQPRPDLITPGQTGQLENVRPYTFAGRVASGPQTPQQMLSRLPMGEMEAGGQAAGALPQKLLLAAMAKQFKPAPSVAKFAQLAGTGKIPEVPFRRMFPALIDEKSGEVIHGMKPTGPGGHAVLYNAAGMMKDFNPTRGFVDPTTFYAYTEADLEEMLMKKIWRANEY